MSGTVPTFHLVPLHLIWEKLDCFLKKSTKTKRGDTWSLQGVLSVKPDEQWAS